MGVVTCKVYTLSDAGTHPPIENVLVRIFDETGVTFITSGLTNASGYFQFDILGAATPIRYQVRCSKIGNAFLNPEYIDVYDPLPPRTLNSFNIYGNIFDVENALNPRMCRASGIFVDPGGRPVPDLVITFANLFDPVIVDYVGIATKVEVRTDSRGYAAVELFRTGKYVATVSGMQDESLQILVPDLPGTRLLDLLYPVVEEVEFTPAGPWSLAAGAQVTLAVVVRASSGAVLEGVATGDVDYIAEDSSIVRVSPATDTITLTGLRPGATTLQITRRDDSIKRIPDGAIIGTGSAITVT